VPSNVRLPGSGVAFTGMTADDDPPPWPRENGIGMGMGKNRPPQAAGTGVSGIVDEIAD
jgi:hypothetical protein